MFFWGGQKVKMTIIFLNWQTQIKGALSALRQFLVTESPVKVMKNPFHLTLKSFLVLKIFTFLS